MQKDGKWKVLLQKFHSILLLDTNTSRGFTNANCNGLNKPKNMQR